jgi:hypothetical protein
MDRGGGVANNDKTRRVPAARRPPAKADSTAPQVDDASRQQPCCHADEWRTGSGVAGGAHVTAAIREARPEAAMAIIAMRAREPSAHLARGGKPLVQFVKKLAKVRLTSPCPTAILACLVLLASRHFPRYKEEIVRNTINGRTAR